MSVSESGRIGRRGTFVIPARLRRIFGLEEGSHVIVEETPDGILIRPGRHGPDGGVFARGGKRNFCCRTR